MSCIVKMVTMTVLVYLDQLYVCSVSIGIMVDLAMYVCYYISHLHELFEGFI